MRGYESNMAMRLGIAATLFIAACLPGLAAAERVELALRCEGKTSVADGMVGPLFLEVIMLKRGIAVTLPFHQQTGTDPSSSHEIVELAIDMPDVFSSSGAIILDFQFSKNFEEGMGDYIGSDVWALSTYGTGNYKRQELTYKVRYWDWRAQSIYDKKDRDIEIARDTGHAVIRDRGNRVLGEYKCEPLEKTYWEARLSQAEQFISKMEYMKYQRRSDELELRMQNKKF